MKEISWRSILSLVYFLVDTKLLLGSLGGTGTVFLLLVASDYVGGTLSSVSPLGHSDMHMAHGSI